MEEIMELVQQHIEEKHIEAMDAFSKSEAHKEEIAELHDAFSAIKPALEEAKRKALWYAVHAGSNYFEKGFREGVEFARRILTGESEDGTDGGDTNG